MEVPNFNDLQRMLTGRTVLLWDMDGTICHTEKFHAMALEQVFLKYSPEDIPYSLTQMEEIGTGLTDKMVFEKLQSQGLFPSIHIHQLLQFKDDSFEMILNSQDLSVIFNEKLRDIFKKCLEQGIKLAVVTSSEKKAAHDLLGALRLTDFFQFIVTQEDTENNKPHPQPYLHAMDLFNVSANNVAIFEDSQVGLEAAHKSLAQVFKAQWYHS